MSRPDRPTPPDPIRRRTLTLKGPAGPPRPGSAPRPIPREDPPLSQTLQDGQSPPRPWPKGKRHDSPPPTIESVQSAREGFELVVDDAERRAQQAEQRAAELERQLRAEKRKSRPEADSEPPQRSLPPLSSGQQDKAALWIGRTVIWLATKARKLGWGGLTGLVGVASILFGSERLGTIWEGMIANNADVAAQRKDNERNADQIEELWTYVACLEESTGSTLESLTPPKEGTSRAVTKIAPFERKCKRPVKPGKPKP